MKFLNKEKIQKGLINTPRVFANVVAIGATLAFITTFSMMMYEVVKNFITKAEPTREVFPLLIVSVVALVAAIAMFALGKSSVQDINLDAQQGNAQAQVLNNSDRQQSTGVTFNNFDESGSHSKENTIV